MKIKPINNHVLVKITEKEKVGTIFIPDMVQQKIGYGVVLEKDDEITDIQVGDTVYFKYYAGSEFEKGVIFLPRKEIQGVVIEEKRGDSEAD